MYRENKKPKNTGLKDARRAEKRTDAESRNASYQRLTLNQKLARQKHGGKVYRKLMDQSELKGA